MEDVAARVCVDGVVGLTQNGTIIVTKIRDRLTQVAADLVITVVGSSSPQRIGGGLISMVERAITGT